MPLGLQVVVLDNLVEVLGHHLLRSLPKHFTRDPAVAQQSLEDLLPEFLLILMISFDDSELEYGKHGSVVRQVRVTLVVVDRQGSSCVVAIVHILEQLGLELHISAHQHSVCVGRNPVLLAGVVLVAVHVVTVGREELDWGFIVPHQDRMLAFDLIQLIVLEQGDNVVECDEPADIVVRQVDSEIQIAKEAFVVVEALGLRQGNAEVVKGLVVNLSDLLHSLANFVLAGLQMVVHEGKRSVVERKPQRHCSFVARHARQSGLDFELLQVLDSRLVFSSREHLDLAPNHRLVNDRNVVWPKGIQD